MTLALPRGGRAADVTSDHADRARLRVMWLIAACGLMTLVLIGRLFYWQVLQHARITAEAIQQHSVTFKLPANRGKIYDRDNQLLASDVTVWNVVADPALVPVEKRADTAGKLAPLLGMSGPELVAKLGAKTRYEFLKKKVSTDIHDQIAAYKLEGIILERDVRRSYLTSVEAGPMPVAAASPLPVRDQVKPSPTAAPLQAWSLASSLLGFVNDEGTGQYGLEQYYNKSLQGHDGVDTTIKDGANTALDTASSDKRVEPRNGTDLVLGIDSQIQFFAEKALAEGVRKTGSESGSVIIMEPKTGDIVAWANYPSFDANRFGGTDPARFTDQIVSGLYEPGSVMKVVTMSGGIDTGAITPDYTFNETGSINVGGYTINDWDHKAHGNITMSRVLELSLNAGAVKVQQMEGPDNFYHYLDAFGIGKPTGIDVAGEVSQQLPPLRSMYASQLATTSFGQGVAVTPIEMITALNSVAAGGRLVAPRTVIATIGPDGRRSDLVPAPGAQVIKATTAEQVKQMMVGVVENGSGKTARIDGWKGRIAGKTGTANIPVNGHYTGDTVASFVGFMPAENPRFTMLVIMRKPQGDAYHQEGTAAAAPTWQEIAQQILLQWQITP